MADKTIPQLPAVTTPVVTDTHPVDQGGVTKKETNAQVLSLLASYTGNIDTSGTINTDTIGEHTAAAGVTIDGSLIKDGSIKVDIVAEKTAANGVAVDGNTFKDSHKVPGYYHGTYSGTSVCAKFITVLLADNDEMVISGTIFSPTPGGSLWIVNRVKRVSSTSFTFYGTITGIADSLSITTGATNHACSLSW